jgi:hypothetical protein
MTQGPTLVRCRILDEPVNLPPFVVFRKVLCDGKAVVADE